MLCGLHGSGNFRAAEERGHHVLRSYQQSHYQHKENQSAEKRVQFAAEDQYATGNDNADDGQGKATGPVTDWRRLFSQLS